jgi:hypothetical protein
LCEKIYMLNIILNAIKSALMCFWSIEHRQVLERDGERIEQSEIFGKFFSAFNIIIMQMNESGNAT